MTRELHSRISQDIQVCLLWHPEDGHVSVAVNDIKTGEAFELPVPEGESALEVFHHPYAYAAWRRDRSEPLLRHSIPPCTSNNWR